LPGTSSQRETFNAETDASLQDAALGQPQEQVCVNEPHSSQLSGGAPKIDSDLPRPEPPVLPPDILREVQN